MLKKIKVAAAACLLIMSLSTPLKAEAVEVTSPFGWRIHPITGESQFHTGIDIAAETGSAIPALWSGEVVLAGEYQGYGLTVVLHHGGGKYTLYGHASAIMVRTGQTVEQGAIIALVGNTGVSTGPHLHLSYVVGGQYRDPMTIWR